MTHQVRCEGEAALEQTEAARALSTLQGFPFFLAFGTVLQGWARVELGQIEQGIAQMRAGLTAYRATGAELATIRFLALLAEAWGKAGKPEEGLTVLAEALAAASANGERDYEAELYRIRGELLVQQARLRTRQQPL